MADTLCEYEKILKEYSDMVTRLCLMHTGDMNDAEDIYQTVFFKLYKELKKGDVPNVKAWLLRVTVNECRSLWRYRMRRNTLSLEDISEIPVQPADRDLWQAVMELPPKYRDVIYLHYYEGYSAEEIAQITRTRASTVRSQMKRGREKLKVQLEQEGSGRYETDEIFG